MSSVSSDLDKLLAPKSLTELEKLDKQITTKLSSHEPIDTDYWEHLRMSLLTYKARAKLRTVSHSIREARLQGLRRRQAAEASAWQARLEASVSDGQTRGDTQAGWADGREEQRHVLDPEPVLRLRAEDKALQSMGEGEFARRIAEDRRAVRRRGYIPNRTRAGDLIDRDGHEPPTKRSRTDADEPPPPSNSLFDREVARGLGENEEIFEAEEEVTTKNKSLWSHQHRPRKPKYFNRMQKGYEWNKYNQTHYDHDNPPPRVVQGYKFNVFYPDLVEKTRAPTYRIEREGGRRRGQTFAPAGEDDTCLIRFMAGPPYEDVAFRIVDREWDYSAKRERGFKSSFDRVRAILPLDWRRLPRVASCTHRALRNKADSVRRAFSNCTSSSKR